MRTFEPASHARPVPVKSPVPKKDVNDVIFPVSAEYLRRKAPPADAAGNVNPELTSDELSAKLDTWTVPVLMYEPVTYRFEPASKERPRP